jgi:hypothetical protein
MALSSSVWTKAFTKPLLMDSLVGSLGSLHVGLELRFGSLNFQATGDGYLICLVDETTATPTLAPVPAAMSSSTWHKKH